MARYFLDWGPGDRQGGLSQGVAWDGLQETVSAAARRRVLGGRRAVRPICGLGNLVDVGATIKIG